MANDPEVIDNEQGDKSVRSMLVKLLVRMLVNNHYLIWLLHHHQNPLCLHLRGMKTHPLRLIRHTPISRSRLLSQAQLILIQLYLQLARFIRALRSITHLLPYKRLWSVQFQSSLPFLHSSGLNPDLVSMRVHSGHHMIMRTSTSMKGDDLMIHFSKWLWTCKEKPLLVHTNMISRAHEEWQTDVIPLKTWMFTTYNLCNSLKSTNECIYYCDILIRTCPHPNYSDVPHCLSPEFFSHPIMVLVARGCWYMMYHEEHFTEIE